MNIKDEKEKVLFIKHNNSVEEILLNYPEKLNVTDCLMSKMISNRIQNYLNESSEDMPKIVILTGQGDRAFCAGGDVTALYLQMKNKEYDKISEFYDHKILSCKCFIDMKPIQISIWNGFAMGGGLGLSANSKIRISTDNSIYAMPETAIGLYPDVGAAFFLTRVFNNIPQIGLYCGLTGYRIEGIECVNSGAATHFVKKENIKKLKEAIINHYQNYDSTLEIEDVISPFCEKIYSPETFYFPNEQIIKQVFIFDSLLNIFSRLEEIIINKDSTYDKESIEWAQRTLDKLNVVSPISLLVFFNLAKIALEHKSIDETYEIDKKLFVNIATHEDLNDFIEGVRALLVDKDKNPKWRYKSVREITNPQEVLDTLFR